MRTPVKLVTMGGMAVADMVGYLTQQTNTRVVFPLDDAGGATTRAVNNAIALGTNIVQYSSFDASTNWSFGDPSIAIAGGKLVFTATPNGKSAYQTAVADFIPLVAGRTYRVTITLSGYVGGHIRVLLGTGTGLDTTDADGTYVLSGTCAGTVGIYIMAIGVTTVNVDSISVQATNIAANSFSSAVLTAATAQTVVGVGKKLRGISLSGNGRANVYSAMLNDAFDMDLFTFGLFIKADQAADWFDMTERYLFNFTGSKTGAPYKFYAVSSGYGSINIYMLRNNVLKSISISVTTADLFLLEIVVDQANDKFYALINGSQYGATRTGVTVWDDNLNTVLTVVGNYHDTVGTGWSAFVACAFVMHEARSAANGLLDAQAGGATIGDIGQPATSGASIVVCDGDSLTYGSGRGTTLSYPYQLNALLTNYEIWNSGIGGERADVLLAAAAAVVDPLFEAARTKNIYVLCIGINDVLVDDAAATIYNDIWSICDGRRTAGYEVIVCNLTPVNGLSAPREIVRQAVNSEIATNWAAHADAYVDFAGNEFLDDPTDATYYVDGIHNTNAGYAVRAALVKAAIDTL